MANLIPELALIIGEQPPVPELPPQDRQNRFQMVFRRFLGVFARPEHPLALFLDDLQWLDAASLDLLEHLVTHPEVKHLLLIGAYRDNEVSFVHPLIRMLASVGKAGARTTQIVLTPLERGDVRRLVADALRCDQGLAQPLAELVHQKTAGNPFFTIQFLAALAEERLIAFDPRVLAWRWDIERIRAKGFTDNVVDLMIGKLRRLPKVTQAALQQLACLGNSCTIATLTRVYGESEEQIHAALWEAVRAGLVLRQNSGYTFLHDRVQEAAYALISEDERAASHLRIGRALSSSLKVPEEFEENIFEIVNQFDRGAALIMSREEREQVAELNLVAGKRAKAASAYASALAYFAAGGALLEDDKWERTSQLAFALELYRAECEYLTGDLASSEQRLELLAGRAGNSVEAASVTCLRATLYTNLDQSDRAIEVGLGYLLCAGIPLPSQPTVEDVRLEYERLRQRLGTRPIEALVDLPPMTDPHQSAVMSVLSTLVPPANFSGETLGAIISIRMAILSLEHGNGDVSAYAYVCLGTLLGRLFGDYQSGYRFSKLGLALTEKHDGLRARVYQTFSNHVAPWMQPLSACRAYVRRAFDAAQQAGELSYAAYSCADLVTNSLAAGAPLGEVEREVENGLEFARKAKFGLVADVIVGQLALVRSLRRAESEFASFDETALEERVFERHLESDPRLTKPMGLYWIRRLQALFLAGDYASAIAAASKAAPTLWALPTDFELAEYHFYGALALAAACDSATSDQRRQHLQALSVHHEKITAWAENCPENFANRAALLGAEIARLNGRELEAEQLYEEAIRSARGNGFVHNEAIANELAARFYMARGLKKISDTYLRDARDCYVRWGADGKVRQLDRSHPYLRSPARPPAPGTTFDAPIEQLDIGAMFKASQALSGEIVLSALIETLMRIAIEHAGAERGTLILFRNNEARIAAEAVTNHGRVEVALQEKIVSHHDVPESALDYVVRTRASLIMDDATASNLFSDDDYVRERRPKSVLCVPVIKQTKLVGALYLENNLTPNAFTPQRIAVLEFLASQAAISLENAYLYADLVRSEAFLSEGQRISHTGSWSWTLSTGKVVWSEEHRRIFGHDPEKEGPPDFQLFLGRLHPEDRAFVQQVLDIAIRDRAGFACDFRIVLPDGLVKYVHGVGRPIVRESGEIDEYIGTTIDVSEQKRNEDALRDAQADLVHVARLTTMGELVASIAHEVNQPLMAIVTNAETCLRWLGREQPDIGEARECRGAHRQERPPRRGSHQEHSGAGPEIPVRDGGNRHQRRDREHSRTDAGRTDPARRLGRGRFAQRPRHDHGGSGPVAAGHDEPYHERHRGNERPRTPAAGIARQYPARWGRQRTGGGGGFRHGARSGERRSHCSIRCSRPSARGWVWACRSRVRLWRPMAAASGRRHVFPMGPFSSSHCPQQQGIRLKASRNEAQPTVIIIDDDRDIREALEGLLRSVGLRVELFASVQEFLDHGRPSGPGCLVLDVRLPGRSGLEFHDSLIEANVHLPVVFISGHADVPMSVRAMKAGAIEFLTKPVRDQELLDAIHLAITKDSVHRDNERAVAEIRANFDTLTQREREVLELVLAGRLNKQIAADIGISLATVKAHRGHVMRKMKTQSLTELVRMVDRLRPALSKT